MGCPHDIALDGHQAREDSSEAVHQDVKVRLSNRRARSVFAAYAPNPCHSEVVRLALKAIARERGTQQRQAADDTTQLRRWLGDAAITSGAVFQSITKGSVVTGTALSARDVGRILKGLVSRAKLSVAGISGHSLRVGTAVDCVAANIDAATIMQAGGWSSVRMVARYTSKLAAKRGAIARLHKLAG